MSATAGETKEPECRTKDLACVLEPVQSLGTYLWNFALFQKIWLLYCWISAPLLSVSNHPPQYCKGEAGAGGWGGVKVDLLWFSLVVLLNSQLVEKQSRRLRCIRLSLSAYLSSTFPFSTGFTITLIHLSSHHFCFSHFGSSCMFLCCSDWIKKAAIQKKGFIATVFIHYKEIFWGFNGIRES